MSQFFTPPKHGNYGISDCEQILDFFKNDTITENEELLVCEDDFSVQLTNNMSRLSLSEQQSFYYLLGSVLYKIKKNFKTCDTCYAPTVTDSNDGSIRDISELTTLRCYKENTLVFPSRYMYL